MTVGVAKVAVSDVSSDLSAGVGAGGGGGGYVGTEGGAEYGDSGNTVEDPSNGSDVS